MQQELKDKFAELNKKIDQLDEEGKERDGQIGDIREKVFNGFGQAIENLEKEVDKVAEDLRKLLGKLVWGFVLMVLLMIGVAFDISLHIWRSGEINKKVEISVPLE